MSSEDLTNRPRDRGPKRDRGELSLGQLLLTALMAALTVAGTVLGLAAPGPTWAKIVAGAVLLGAVLGVVVWWSGYRTGRRR